TTGWGSPPASRRPVRRRAGFWTTSTPGENGGMTEERRQRPRARDLNEVIRYTMWSVFRLRDRLPDDREEIAGEVGDLLTQAGQKDVVTRGVYEVSGFRADADYMFWWHS